MSLYDTRNLQALHRRQTVSAHTPKYVGDIIKTVCLLQSISDQAGYCLDAPEVLPTGGLKDSGVEHGNGRFFPDMTYR